MKRENNILSRKICRLFLMLVIPGLCSALLLECKKPYAPSVTTSATNYLVIEGVIDAGGGQTSIKLSRSVNLSSGTAKNPETGAALAVESDQNSTYPLTETNAGSYIAFLKLDNARKYRLRIKTTNNQEYLSDFVEVKVTPPIDSIGFTANADGVKIYANTHDPNNNTHYYRWDYDETWQFHAKYASNYITNGDGIVGRYADQFTYTCFASDTSSSIVLGSSAKLSQDVIFQAPITSIPSTSEKIETKYSIQLREYALTADAYTFWLNLKKNTEQLGSIFDAEPTNIPGNIHNTANAAEPVIGYLSACVVQTKRVFIVQGQLPNYVATYPYDCKLDTNLYCYGSDCMDQVAINLVPLGSTEIPVSELPPGSHSAIGYLSSDVLCTDCTLRGTKTVPAFWK